MDVKKLDSDVAKFKCYGYERIQSRYGTKLLLNIFISRLNKGHRINQILVNDAEINEFFRSIKARRYSLEEIPSSEGYCRVKKNCNEWMITEWIEGDKNGTNSIDSWH